MELTSRLVRPFAKRYRKYSGKVSAFAGPVRSALTELLGHVPNIKAFAGSEDLADDSAETNDETVAKKGIIARLKNFKKSLKEMSDFQKLILLTVAVIVPAGILISTLLVGFIKKRRAK